MRITTEGTLTAIEAGNTVIIIGLDGAMREADFKPLIQKIGLDIEVNSRSWDYCEEDGYIVWSVTR